MNIKSLLAATFAVASMSTLSMAQTRTIEHEYSEFDAISVSDGFKVSFVESDGYSAKFKVTMPLRVMFNATSRLAHFTSVLMTNQFRRR